MKKLYKYEFEHPIERTVPTIGVTYAEHTVRGQLLHDLFGHHNLTSDGDAKAVKATLEQFHKTHKQ